MTEIFLKVIINHKTTKGFLMADKTKEDKFTFKITMYLLILYGAITNGYLLSQGVYSLVVYQTVIISVLSLYISNNKYVTNFLEKCRWM